MINIIHITIIITTIVMSMFVLILFLLLLLLLRGLSLRFFQPKPRSVLAQRRHSRLSVHASATACCGSRFRKSKELQTLLSVHAPVSTSRVTIIRSGARNVKVYVMAMMAFSIKVQPSFPFQAVQKGVLLWIDCGHRRSSKHKTTEALPR